jgi:hypothetical protein
MLTYAVNRRDVLERFDDQSLQKTVAVDLGIVDYLDRQIAELELFLTAQAKVHDVDPVSDASRKSTVAYLAFRMAAWRRKGGPLAGGPRPPGRVCDAMPRQSPPRSLPRSASPSGP